MVILLAFLLAFQTDLAERLTATHPQAAKVVIAARSAPPEFAARALIRLATRIEGLERRERSALLKEAFEVAAAAPEPLPMRAIPGPLGGTRAQERGLASSTGIDRLTLQAKALFALLEVDPAAVRPLFDTMAAPRMAAAACRDALLPNPAKWFELVSALPRARWTAEEVAREAHIAALESAVRGIASPVEIAPALDAIAAAKLTEEQRDRLIGAVAVALERLSGDDRSFTATLAEAEMSVGKWPALNASWKRYVTANLINTRCAETVDPQWPYLATLNRITGQLDLRADFDPESATTDRADLRPLLTAAQRGELDQYAQSVRQMQTSPAALRELVQSMEGRLASWDFAGAPGVETADYRGYILGGMAAALPPGELKDRLLRNAVRAAAAVSPQASSRLEWFGVMHALVNATGGPDRPRLLALFEQSGHPLLTLEAQLERAAPAFGPAVR